MPAARVDGGRWRHLWSAFRGWLRRTFARRERPALPPPGDDEAGPAVAVAEDAGQMAWPPRVEAPPPSPAALDLTALGPHARVTWSMQWRQPLLRVPCPRCEAPLDLPVSKVLCYEDVSCRWCGLTLRRTGKDGGIHAEG